MAIRRKTGATTRKRPTRTPKPPGVLRAQAIELVDAAGKRRNGLAIGPAGTPMLVLEDSAGKGHIHLSVNADGEAGVGLGDREGHGRVLLGVKADESAGAAFYDKAGTLRAVLGLTARQMTSGAPAAESPSAAVALFDAEGQSVFQAPGPRHK